MVLFELANDAESLKLKLIIGPVDKSDTTGIAFREAVFACSQKYRQDFPGGMTTLAPRFTTILMRELVKRKDYESPESVPDKAREALSKAFQHDLPAVLKRLREVFSSGQSPDGT